MRGGFVVLEDTPEEVLAGAVGRFWPPSGDLARIEASQLRAFAEPRYAKAAFDLRAAGPSALPGCGPFAGALNAAEDSPGKQARVKLE